MGGKEAEGSKGKKGRIRQAGKKGEHGGEGEQKGRIYDRRQKEYWK